MTPAALVPWLEGLRLESDALLQRLCRAGEAPGRLGEAVAYALSGGGKRLRPVLVLASFDASLPFGEPPRAPRGRAHPPACAVELIHTYSLLHDDLPAMDDDDFRRGRPSTHRAYGEAAAILAGDALLTEAFRVLSDPSGYPEGESASLRATLCTLLAEAAGHRGMVGGQGVDLGLSDKVEDEAGLDALHRAKTGALFVFSTHSGALAAGAPPSLCDRLTVYGDRLGLAFQIADDLLDLVQDGESGDSSGPPSYPSVLGEETSRRRARELAEEAMEAVTVLGNGAAPLQALARYAVERDR